MDVGSDGDVIGNHDEVVTERFGKLRDVYKYRKLDESGAFDRPKMPTPDLVVDTTNQSPLDSARMIAKHLRQVVLR